MHSRSHRLLTIVAFATLPLLSPDQVQAAAGDLYQANTFSHNILKYAPAGGAPTTFSGGLQGTTNHLAFNRSGDLFVNDGNSVAKITPAGVKTTFATSLNVNGLECDRDGNLFVSDGLTRSIIKITPGGVKSTFAPAVDTLDLAFDPGGNLYAADFGADPSNPSGPGIDGQGKVYKFTPDGTKTVAHGSLNRPKRLAIDARGHTYIASSDGTIIADNIYYSGGDIIGDSFQYAGGLGNIQGLACDALGNVFVSTPSGIIRYDHTNRAKTTFSPTSDPADLEFEPPRSLALNIATRLGVQAGENVLIGGFIITETGGKSVVIRGIGPSLSAAGVQGALQDPIIELHYPGGFVNTNDNWKDTQASQIQATGLAPTDDRESAFTYNLGPGNYTIVLKGKNNTAGIGLIEVYDINQSSGRLANISTRGFVGSGDNLMIGGFILGGGNGAARVMIRAIGPSLAAFGISNPLQNPTVTLRDGNGAVLSANDDWGVGSSATEIYLSGLGPSSQAESAVVVTLPNGNYTAVVSGVNGGTGVGLVEAYNLN